MRYENFDIWIEDRYQDGYPLRASSTRFGEVRNTLSLDPMSAELGEAVQSLTARETDEGFLVELGKKLHGYLFGGEVGILFSESYGDVSQDGDSGLRVRLRIVPPEISALPWELLYSPSIGDFLATSEQCPLVRYLEIHQRIRALETPLPLRMLVAIPGGVDPYPELDTSVEKASVLQALDPLKGAVIPTFLEGHVDYARISDALLEERCHCFHFIGHGDFRDGKGFLLLNTKNGDDPWVDEDRFARLFANHEPMKLVVLNACKGAEVSSSRPFVGMAPNLVKRGIPAVVAMQYAIADDAAVLFAREFYGKLFRGWNKGRVDVAISHARNRLLADFPGEREMATPVLFLRAGEGVLFNLVTGNRLEDAPLRSETLDTARAVEKTYVDNQAVEPHAADAAELQRLKDRIRFSHQVLASGVAAVFLVFCLSWVGAFDLLLGLGTWSEMWTVWLGDPFVEKKLHGDIQIVAVEDDPAYAEDWRTTVAIPVIQTLSKAGAKAIVFDVAFEKSKDSDKNLIGAVSEATSRGAAVVFGIASLPAGGELREPLTEAGCRFGLMTVGSDLGYLRTVTLAIRKPEGDELFSLGLRAIEAYRDAILDGVDGKHQEIVMENPKTGKERFAFALWLDGGGGYRDAKARIIEKGDRVADVFLDLSPRNLLLDRQTNFKDLVKLEPTKLTERFGDKIVIVGERTETDMFRVYPWPGGWRPGFELHVDAVNTLLRGIVIRPLGWAGQLVLMLALGLLGSLIRIYLPPTRPYMRKCVILAVVVLYLMGTIYVYVVWRVLLNTLYHIVALLFCYQVAGRLERRWAK